MVKNFGEKRHFLFSYMIFWSVMYFDELNHMKVLYLTY